MICLQALGELFHSVPNPMGLVGINWFSKLNISKVPVLKVGALNVGYRLSASQRAAPVSEVPTDLSHRTGVGFMRRQCLNFSFLLQCGYCLIGPMRKACPASF